MPPSLADHVVVFTDTLAGGANQKKPSGPSHPNFNSLRLSDVYIDGWVQERRNSSALAMELVLSCFNSLRPSDAYMRR